MWQNRMWIVILSHVHAIQCLVGMKTHIIIMLNDQPRTSLRNLSLSLYDMGFFVPTRHGITWTCDRITIHIRFCHMSMRFRAWLERRILYHNVERPTVRKSMITDFFSVLLFFRSLTSVWYWQRRYDVLTTARVSPISSLTSPFDHTHITWPFRTFMHILLHKLDHIKTIQPCVCYVYCWQFDCVCEE